MILHRWIWSGTSTPTKVATAALTVAALAVGGCGSSDERTAESTAGARPAEPATVVVATPFPSALAFPELYVAQARGYFDDLSLDVSVEPLDGSGSTLQSLETGQVQVAVPSPGPIMQAAERGGTPLTVYTSYQKPIFSLVTIPASGVTTLEQLEGKTIGVGALDGGEVPVVKGLLADLGLREGEDYRLLAVGDGGTASAALERGDVAAYGAAFVDLLILEGAGVRTVDLAPDGYGRGTDSHYVVSRELADGQPDVVGRFGRALAQGASALHADPAGQFDEICGAYEEECADREFARRLFDAVLELQELPPEARGRWGWTDVAGVQEYADLLVDQGELRRPVEAGELFTNEFLSRHDATPAPPAERR